MLWNLKGDWAEAQKEKFDLSGSAIYGLALASMIYGLSLLPAAQGYGFVIGGTMVLVAFIIEGP